MTKLESGRMRMAEIRSYLHEYRGTGYRRTEAQVTQDAKDVCTITAVLHTKVHKFQEM